MKKTLAILVGLALGALTGCSLWNAGSGPCVRYVDEFDLSRQKCGAGLKALARQSVCGNPLKVGSTVYARGFGVRPESAVAFRSNGKVLSFDALLGMDVDCKSSKHGPAKSGAKFRVWADGAIVYESHAVVEGVKPVQAHVELEGAREIVLETASLGPWFALDGANADWLDARFTCGAGATLEIIDDADAFAELGVLTPPEGKAPRFNGADIWGVRPGHEVIYRVPISGVRPMTLTASNLPPGVVFDAKKGVLRGVAPQTVGDYDIEVRAVNAYGAATRTIRLAVGDTICLTPPMGWNSWNVWCHRLTAEYAKASTRAMEESGLGDYGWAYINLDDWWEMNNSQVPRVEERRQYFNGRDDVKGPARDANGKINPNRSFPDMKGLTDYIHSFGFKAGLYSSPGPVTCGVCEGSYGHELQDAESWADWGFDYIKYDWCSYGKIFNSECNTNKYWDVGLWKSAKHREAFIKPYRLMGECLKRQKRDIVYSFCQYGMAEVETWGRAVGANCWRSFDDLKDGWTWMEMAIDSRVNGEFWKWTGPGFWADPDMMIIGQQYSFNYDHPSLLTPNEQYTHVSIWSMLSAPLLIGCDLTKLDDFTRGLLVNSEVIAISQDRLGRPARRYRHLDGESVWARPLANGDWAVALYNRSPIVRNIRISLSEFGLSGAHDVRDCWRQQTEARTADVYETAVPTHGTKLIRLHRIECPKCDR